MRGECNSKTVKRSFTGLDTAEPKLVFYKDNVIFITTQTKPSIISFFHNKLSIKVYARCVFVESTVRIWHHSNTQPVSLPVPPRDILPNEQPWRRQLKKYRFVRIWYKKSVTLQRFLFMQNHSDRNTPPHRWKKRRLRYTLLALVAELVDAPDLGSGVSRRVGSSPIRRTRTTPDGFSLPPGVLFSHHTFINIHARIH